MLDEIKAILSPAEAWLWAELGNKIHGNPYMSFCSRIVLIVAKNSKVVVGISKENNSNYSYFVLYSRRGQK